MDKKIIYNNARIFMALIFFGLLLSACNKDSITKDETTDELSTPLELRDVGCFTITRDFCAPGECCTYTACSDYTYQGGNPFTLVSNSPASSIIPHPVVIDEPMCWTIVTCESGSFTMMAGPYIACTQSVKCGSCPVTTTFNAMNTENLQNDLEEFSDCCIFDFNIAPIPTPNQCALRLTTGPRGGVAHREDLQGTIRVCPDEDVELILQCEDGSDCQVCIVDVECP